MSWYCIELMVDAIKKQTSLLPETSRDGLEKKIMINDDLDYSFAIISILLRSFLNFHSQCVWLIIPAFWYLNMLDVTAGYGRIFDLVLFFLEFLNIISCLKRIKFHQNFTNYVHSHYTENISVVIRHSYSKPSFHT